MFNKSVSEIANVLITRKEFNEYTFVKLHPIDVGIIRINSPHVHLIEFDYIATHQSMNRDFLEFTEGFVGYLDEFIHCHNEALANYVHILSHTTAIFYTYYSSL